MEAQPDRPDLQLDRRRAVALNADVVGYSRHIADDPDATVESMRFLQAIVRNRVAENDGVPRRSASTDRIIQWGAPVAPIRIVDATGAGMNRIAMRT